MLKLFRKRISLHIHTINIMNTISTNADNNESAVYFSFRLPQDQKKHELSPLRSSRRSLNTLLAAARCLRCTFCLVWVRVIDW